jgi:glycosyltransferase involved in cell wall biosynthesis
MTDAPARRTKVLMVCSQVPPVYGGAGQQALSLASKLHELGCTVTVLTLNQAGAPALEETETYRVVRVGRAPRSARLFRSLQSLRLSLASFIHSAFGRYDIVHFHGSYWWTVAGFFGARMRRRPVVVKVTRLHEDDPSATSAKHLGPIPLGWLYGAPHRGADAVIALSDEIVQASRRVGIEPLMIPNGVDTDTFRPATGDEKPRYRERFGLSVEGTHILYCGYLVEHKGVSTLVSAWRSIRPGLSSGSTLVLAGPTDGFYREIDLEFMETLRASAHDAGSVVFLGKVERSDMPALYQSADIYCLLSDVEGMPNSLIEALASGLPAVASDIPGNREVMIPEAGELVPPRDAESAAKAMRALVEELRADEAGVRRRARRRAEAMSLQQTARTYALLYNDIQGSPRKSLTKR